jgi:hypothetical protein
MPTNARWCSGAQKRTQPGLAADAPAYQHSTSSAAARGHKSIFMLLARQAHAKIQLAHLVPQKDKPKS